MRCPGKFVSEQRQGAADQSWVKPGRDSEVQGAAQGERLEVWQSPPPHPTPPPTAPPPTALHPQV